MRKPIEEIREKLAMSISTHSEWDMVLNKTNPGHYGVVASGIFIDGDNVKVDFPNRKFIIDDVIFDFILQHGNSSEDDGFPQSFTRKSSGEGRFRFDEQNEKVIIEALNLNVDLDLFY